MRVEAWFLHKWFEVIGLFLCVCMCVCVTDRVNVRKKDSEENSHCCPQQPNLSSSALLTMKLPGKRFSKITNTAHMHTHTRTHTHAHTHARMQTAHTHMLTNQNRHSKSYKKTVWGKKQSQAVPCYQRFTISAPGCNRASLWVLSFTNKAGVLEVDPLLFIIPFHFIILFFSVSFPFDLCRADSATTQMQEGLPTG